MIVRAGHPLGEGLSPTFNGIGNLRRSSAGDHAQHAGLHLLPRAKRIASREDAGLLQLALLQAIWRHAQRRKDRGDLWSAAVVNTQRERLVALQLPAQALQAFAGHALVAVVLGGEAHELGRILRLRHALLLKVRAG